MEEEQEVLELEEDEEEKMSERSLKESFQGS